MGDQAEEKKKARQTSKDRAEFGAVTNVEQLEPTELDSQHAKSVRPRLENPDEKGYFEGASSGLVTPLKLDEDNPEDATNPEEKSRQLRSTPSRVEYGADVDEYEAAYNSYAVPYRFTMNAMGRLKDLSTAGAPMTPAEFRQKRPDLAARYARIMDGKAETLQNSNANNAFHIWDNQTAQTVAGIEAVASSEDRLAEALHAYQSVQYKLQARRVQAQKSAAQAELAEIDEAANTLAEIVKTSYEAVGACAEIEAALSEGVTLTENGEGIEQDVNSLPEGQVNFDGGTVDDPHRTNERVGESKQQKVGSGAAAVADSAKAGSAIVKKTQALLKARGQSGTKDFSLDLHDVFVIAMGDGDKYKKLHADIEKFDGQLANLNEKEFHEDIEGAQQKLNGSILDVKTVVKSVNTNMNLSRRDAQGYSIAKAGGDEGMMAMYAAEASIEVAKLGEVADGQRKALVDPLWKRVALWLNNTPPETFGRSFAEDPYKHNDYVWLRQNVVQVEQERTYLTGILPEWQKNASDWRSFFAQKLGAGS